MKIEKKSLKNYFILIITFVLTIGLVLYLCDCYKVYKENKQEVPVILGTLTEISSIEFDHYLLDNPSTVVYICTASNNECRNYEEKLIKLIKQKDLSDDIVYLNIPEEEVESFVDDFNQKYPYKVKLTANRPAFVIFYDGKVDGILQDNKSKLTMQKTKQFIELNNIGAGE